MPIRGRSHFSQMIDIRKTSFNCIFPTNIILQNKSCYCFIVVAVLFLGLLLSCYLRQELLFAELPFQSKKIAEKVRKSRWQNFTTKLDKISQFLPFLTKLFDLKTYLAKICKFLFYLSHQLFGWKWMRGKLTCSLSHWDR